MKKNIYKIFGLMSVLFISSCNYDEINVNPDQPSDVPASTMLLPTQAALAFTQGDDIARNSLIWMQQFAGVDRQALVVGRYTLLENDINSAWNNYYVDVLKNSQVIIEKAAENGSPHLAGVSQVLSAITIGQLTDYWGAIPLSNSLQGESASVYQATYDSQQTVYDSIQGLLDVAKVNLAAEESNVSPTAKNDLVYGGDLGLWTKTANVIKARHHNNLSQVDPQGSATAALAAIDAGVYESSEEDAEFTFGAAPNEHNPWAQFAADRTDTRLGEFFVNLLTTKADPRLPFFVEDLGDGEYVGAPAGSNFSAASNIGPYYGSEDSPVPLATYAEVKFIEAEAALRLNNMPRAQAAFTAAITGSMAKYGISEDEINLYLASYGTLNANPTEALAQIMTEKYVALFTMPQVYTDWRRTGFPNLTPAAGNVTNDVIPTKYPYPLSERQYNETNLRAITDAPQSITNKVWWDQ